MIVVTHVATVTALGHMAPQRRRAAGRQPGQHALHAGRRLPIVPYKRRPVPTQDGPHAQVVGGAAPGVGAGGAAVTLGN